MKPTTEQIKAEIAALTAVKPKLPKRNHFNENIQDNVEAQIDVLTHNLPEDTIWNRCGEEEGEELEWTESERDAALDARRWLDGEAEQAPSEDWKELAQ